METGEGYNSDYEKNILILADFADGNWHAISFAMNHLYQPHSIISILQTYQSPHYGTMMMRNIEPRLKKITKDELNALKNKLLSNFELSEKQIQLLSFKGGVAEIIHTKLRANTKYNIVIGTYSAFTNSCTIQNLCMSKIINCTEHPVFIVPKLFEPNTAGTLLFVACPDKLPSLAVLNQINSICEKAKLELEVLFVTANKDQIISNEVIEFLETHLSNINFSIQKVINNSVCKGMQHYLKKNCRELIIVERNSSLASEECV